MGEYDLDTFGQLINDKVRMQAFDRALAAAVKPGSVVLDIGTGTGILAMLACRYGARRVHAVELDPVIETARELAVANGLADRIQFHATDSTQLELHERVDVVVSDIYGVLPWHRRRIPVLRDARDRLMKPGGVMIPRRERLWLALVCDSGLHRVVVEPWVRNPYGLDMRAARDLAANQWRRVDLAPGQLASAPVACAGLDHESEPSPHLSFSVDAAVLREGDLVGFGLWFDSELADGIGFSNAPGGASLIYGNAFFAWPEPVTARAGDVARVKVRATLSGSHYVWAWDSTILAGGDAASLRASFRQSTLFGMTLAPSELAKVSADHVGTLGSEGEVVRAILEGLAEGRPLGAIAQAVETAFPDRFSHGGGALSEVSRIALKYGR